jgi:hypothetical protein
VAQRAPGAARRMRHHGHPGVSRRECPTR